MQMERRNNGEYFCNHQFDRGLLMEATPPSKSFSINSSHFLMQPSSSGACGSSVGDGGRSSAGDSGGGLGYIKHTVTKFDTLAGVAIKYGVEVADIKKMNGLTTDLQMFSRKWLQIPLPGRHPPSPIMSNGSDTQGATSLEATPPSRGHSDLFDSIKSLKLSSSSSLRSDHYGSKSNYQNGIGEGFEMAVYRKSGPRFLLEEGGQPQTGNMPRGLHRKSKSLAYELLELGDMDTDIPSVTNGKESNSFEKLVRRRKSEVDLKNHTPEMLLKQDPANNNGSFSAANAKGLALRPKAASRTAASDADAGSQHMFAVGFGESLVAETFNRVRKSLSTPSFQDPDNNNNNNNNNNTSIWPTSVLSLTADLQALSTAAITRPILDGLPKPITGRKNKAAID